MRELVGCVPQCGRVSCEDWKLSRRGERWPWPLAEEPDESLDVLRIVDEIRFEESLGFHHSGLVTGTRVDVRNLESTFPLWSNQFATTSQRNFGFNGPKCPSKRNQPWPNWRCANGDLWAESNNSLH